MFEIKSLFCASAAFEVGPGSGTKATCLGSGRITSWLKTTVWDFWFDTKNMSGKSSIIAEPRHPHQCLWNLTVKRYKSLFSYTWNAQSKCMQRFYFIQNSNKAALDERWKVSALSSDMGCFFDWKKHPTQTFVYRKHLSFVQCMRISIRKTL